MVRYTYSYGLQFSNGKKSTATPKKQLPHEIGVKNNKNSMAHKTGFEINDYDFRSSISMLQKIVM